MTLDALVAPDLIKLDAFPIDPGFKLRIARADEDKKVLKAFNSGHLEVQAGGWTQHYATLSLVGSELTPRPVASLTVSLRQFEEVVRYDPANPPADEYFSGQYKKYHQKTQSDFTGAKKKNLLDYTDYGLEALRGERHANIPEINGWIDLEASQKSVFVVLHNPEPGVFYGKLFLPSLNPVMQSDGQTQTAMLFRLSRTKLGAEHTDTFRVKLEVEFGVTPEFAGQAFADRNGRGTKKNRNLVQDLTVVGGIAQLVKGSIDDTIFDGRTYNGRGGSVSETSTQLILDLSTMEQVVMNVCTNGAAKPEHIKPFHVATYLPIVRDFLEMLDRCFGDKWKHPSEPDEDPYRATYVHGWSFSFKALARAYFRTRIDELGPLADALRAYEPGTEDVDTEEAWKARAERFAAEDDEREDDKKKYVPPITPEEFEERLSNIDWIRHRKHWVDITGYTRNSKTGQVNTKTLKTGETVVKAKAPTQMEVINGMVGKILGPKWTDLTGSENFDWKAAS